MRPFDVYRGEQVGEGRKSIAFAVTFQSAERTLTDEDAAKLRERIVDCAAPSASAPSYEPRALGLDALRPARRAPCAGSPAAPRAAA